MESDLVNETPTLPIESVNIVENYFNENLAKQKLIDKGTHAGYWWLTYIDNEIKIHFDGDIGGVFNVIIYIEEQEYPLWQYDRRVLDASKTNSKNLTFVLGVVSEFLKDM
ncbi:hypothetical protein ACT3CD_16860 [Geofilum sp. OHC36d9]|uniref:hypothetical protein n=1 Tax=Geofilum sp. OHC36d9 TaxID=3458413 RepID=UPI0040335CDF